MKKKILCMTITLLLTLTAVGPVPALAAEDSLERLPVENVQANTISPRADHYVVYYRTVNGVLQYRIWNATDAVWATEWKNV